MAGRREAGDPREGAEGELPGRTAEPGPARRPAPAEETDLPALDIYETAEEVVIEAELPGVDPARIEVWSGEGAILIEGVKEGTPGPERVTFLCMERAFGPFRRVVPIGRAADLGRASATCTDGVLQVRVPKVEEKRGGLRAVPVRTGEHREGRSEP